MNKEKKEGIDIVVEAMNQYLTHVVETTQFNLQELFNFMEPKFVEAGYRAQSNFGEKNNVLIIHDAGAGDFVLQSPAIREIRRIYPDANITLVVTPPAAELAECCPYVNELLINNRKFDAEDILNVIQWNFEFATNFLRKRFDVCYASPCWFDTPLLMYMSGAKTRVATYVYENIDDEIAWTEKRIMPLAMSINLATQIFPHYENAHRVDLNLSPVDNTLHAPVSNRAPEIWYTAYDFSVAKFLLQDAKNSIYALHMGGSHPRKMYPPEKYATFIEAIAKKEPKATFVILGSGEDDLQAVEEFKKATPKIYEKKVIDLTGKINYRQSAAVLSLCDMYIGNDSGAMHIAAAVGCPVLEISPFPADISAKTSDAIHAYHPYNIPLVMVQPEHALPECAEDTEENPHSAYGCKVSDEPHCITQIETKTLLKGFKQLKERVAKKINEPIYIS